MVARGTLLAAMAACSRALEGEEEQEGGGAPTSGVNGLREGEEEGCGREMGWRAGEERKMVEENGFWPKFNFQIWGGF